MRSWRDRFQERLRRHHCHPHPPPNPDDTVSIRVHLWLVVHDKFAVRLIPNRKVFVMEQLHVNETDTLSILATDEFGNIVDSAVSNVVWSNSNEAAAVSSNPTPETLLLTPVTNAVGQETTVDVSVTISGTTFTAQDTLTIVAGPVAGIRIVHNFAPRTAPPTT